MVSISPPTPRAYFPFPGGPRRTPGSRPWTPLPEFVSPSPKDKTGLEVSDRTWGTEFVFLD